MAATLKNGTITPNRESRFYEILAYAYLAVFLLIGIFWGINPALLVALTIIAAIFILPRPETGLWLILGLTMVFERYFTLQSLVTENSLYKIYPLDILIILTFCGWLIRLRLGQVRKLIFGWPEKLLLLFIAVVAAFFVRSLYDLNADIDVAFSTFKNYAFYPLLYFLVIGLIDNAAKLKKTVHVILLAGVAIIFFIAYGFLSGQGLWTEFTPLSTEGVRFLAGTHAFFLVVASLLGLALLAFGRLSNLTAVSLIFWLWMIGLSGSLMRHLWLAWVVAVLALFLALKKNGRAYLRSYLSKNFLVAVSIVVSLLFVFINFSVLPDSSDNLFAAISSFENRVTSLTAGTGDTSANWRINLWRSAWQSWSKEPIFGLGLGRQIPLEIGDFKKFEEARNMHNSLIAIGAQTGLVGFALFIALLLAVLATGLKSISRQPDLAPYLIGAFAGLVALLVACLFQPYLETNLTGIFFWILLGLLRAGSIMKTNTGNK